MKKFMLLALAALCVSAAQAVTYTWNSSEGTFAGFKDSNGNTVSVSGSFTLIFDFTMTSTANDVTKMIQLLPSGGADTQGEFRVNWGGDGNKADVGLYKGSSSANWYGTNGQAFTATRLTSNGGHNQMSVSFIFDENTQTCTGATYSITFANGNTITDQNLTHNLGGNNGFNGPAEWTSLATYNGLTMNSMSLTVVPEPTALALLALGVAGLALKRKVA